MENSIDSVSLLEKIYNSTYDYGIFTYDLDGKINTWNIGAERTGLEKPVVHDGTG